MEEQEVKLKVLIFSHRSDIDGMGSIIFSKLAFDNVTYVLCESKTLETEFLKYLEDKSIYDYDFVYITDLTLSNNFAKKIASLKRLKNKVFIFDHHRFTLEDVKEKYNFLTVKIKDIKGLCSGTSLFYDYLVENTYLDKNNKLWFEFKELVRKYDTWEWKTIYNDTMPRDLTYLFLALDADTYIDMMYKKLKEKKIKFKFNKYEKMLIASHEKIVSDKIKYAVDNLYYREFKGVKLVIALAPYDFRNDIADYLRDIGVDASFIAIVSVDYNTISFRTINNDLRANDIAKYFDGRGSDKAAGGKIKREVIEKMLDNLF